MYDVIYDTLYFCIEYYCVNTTVNCFIWKQRKLIYFAWQQL